MLNARRVPGGSIDRVTREAYITRAGRIGRPGRRPVRRRLPDTRHPGYAVVVDLPVHEQISQPGVRRSRCEARASLPSRASAHGVSPS
jgi:hypothetical protein